MYTYLFSKEGAWRASPWGHTIRHVYRDPWGDRLQFFDYIVPLSAIRAALQSMCKSALDRTQVCITRFLCTSWLSSIFNRCLQQSWLRFCQGSWLNPNDAVRGLKHLCKNERYKSSKSCLFCLGGILLSPYSGLCSRRALSFAGKLHWNYPGMLITPLTDCPKTETAILWNSVI